MGGKSPEPAPPPAAPPAFDMEGMMGMMSAMMGSMGAMQPPAMPTLPEAPEVERTPEVDWKERNEQLQARMKGEQYNEDARRKGRSDTIHTSPLLDEAEEEETTATSLLTESV